MKRLSDVLATTFESPEIMKAAKAQRAMRKWPEAVGTLLAERTQADRYDHGVVWVATSGSAWAQEIRMRKDDILVRLNDIAGENLFTDIRVGVRVPRPW
jgi:predicted nucleic acid-binding Zn ribbon protein